MLTGELCGDVYRIDEVCKVYKKEFGIVRNESTWCQYIGPKLYLDPALKHTVKGRPKSTCFLNEMDMCEIRGS